MTAPRRLWIIVCPGGKSSGLVHGYTDKHEAAEVRRLMHPACDATLVPYTPEKRAATRTTKRKP